MSSAVTWVALLVGSAVVFALKLVGHLVPKHWLAEPRVARTAALVTVALLSALVAVQTATRGHELVLDARSPRSRSPPWRSPCAHRSSSSCSWPR